MSEKIQKSQALSILNTILLDARDIVFVRDKDDPSWMRLKRKVQAGIDTIFGDASVQMLNLRNIVLGIEFYQDQDYWGEHAVQEIVDFLNLLIGEISEFWADDNDSFAGDNQQSADGTISDPQKIFIVHGHNHGILHTVSRFIEKLGLEAVILIEQASRGDTVIEKLEKHADVSFAIVILSPDDIGAAVREKDKLQFRARQNVILELGYFMGKLGRKNTCAIVVDEVEIPSDYHGIIYISFDSRNAWKLSLAQELREAGFKFDANKVL